MLLIEKISFYKYYFHTDCLIPRNDDDCLQNSPNWLTSDKCETTNLNLCDSWAKDMRRCCPERCGTGTFTEPMCNDMHSAGTCLYPNAAQCSIGCMSRYLDIK